MGKPYERDTRAPKEVSDDHALHFLAEKGYLPLALADHPGMVEAYTDLFAQSHKFFDLPADSPQKTTYQAVSGPAASEEGYSTIPREKSILTTRTSNRCPVILHDKLKTAWDLTGKFMQNITTAIAKTLGLDPNVFGPLVEPCANLTDKKTPTQLRMFRYDRPQGIKTTVNAEKHKDLGLLSLVIGHSPGLQVLDTSASRWVSIEEEPAISPTSFARSDGLTATLLGGETLAFLSRNKYKAGVHRVVCAPASIINDPYRFSIVFTLRPAVAPLYTKNFESDITGEFEAHERADGESSSVLFGKIMRSHWNINAARDVREKQKEERRLKHKAMVEAGGGQSDVELTKPLSG